MGVRTGLCFVVTAFFALNACDTGDKQTSGQTGATGASGSGDTEGGGGGDTELSSSISATTPQPTSAGTDPPDDPTEGEAESSGGSFLGAPDAGGAANECDIWAQDCPAGEKCRPYDDTGGGYWNATKCSPLADDPGSAGDPCTMMGDAVNGVDDCDANSMCFGVDGETLEGTCTEMCTGSPGAPMCSDPNQSCSITNDGVLILCGGTCDPVLQACPGDEGCVLAGDGLFRCRPLVSGLELGEPCEATNVCLHGLFCVNSALIGGCDTGFSYCCAEFCDNTDPGAFCTAAAAGNECIAWYDEDAPAPPGLEHVGFCALPGQ